MGTIKGRNGMDLTEDEREFMGWRWGVDSEGYMYTYG